MKPTHISPTNSPTNFTLRHDLQPGDLGHLVSFHGKVCAWEYGFDWRFEADIASRMAEFVQSRSDRDQLWIAERDRRLVGCLALIGLSPKDAHIDWFLVDPPIRGVGLGRWLLGEAVAFCECRGYECVFLRTIRGQKPAANLYLSVGFEKSEQSFVERWGVEVNEERYVLHPAKRYSPSKH